MDFDFNKLSKEEQEEALNVMREMCEDVDKVGAKTMDVTINLALKYSKESLEFMKSLADDLHPDEACITDQTKAIVKAIIQIAISLKEEMEKRGNE